MTYASRMEAGYLLNNADVLNKILLDRSANYSVSNELYYRQAGMKNTDHARVHFKSGNNCPLNRELMEQMQNFQVIINLLAGLRR